MHLPKAVCDEGGVGGGGTAAVRRRALYRMENACTGFGPPCRRTDIPDSVNRLNCARFTPRSSATPTQQSVRYEQPLAITADRWSRGSGSVTRDNPLESTPGGRSR